MFTATPIPPGAPPQPDEPAAEVLTEGTAERGEHIQNPALETPPADPASHSHLCRLLGCSWQLGSLAGSIPAEVAARGIMGAEMAAAE